jgi:mercuric ion transport protein
MQILRYAFVAAAWLFFVGIVYQVFLAGVGLLGGGDMTAHMSFGWGLPLFVLVLFLAALAALPGWRTFGITALLLVLTWVQIFLPGFRTVNPLIAALHPVNALALFWLALTVARRATELVSKPRVVPSEVAVPQEA